VNSSVETTGLVPLGVVTVTFTVPVLEGEVAVICVAELTVKLGAVLMPKATAVAPENPVPVMVTEVPPVVGPVLGLSPVMVGKAT
jgi:hypothetical protein